MVYQYNSMRNQYGRTDNVIATASFLMVCISGSSGRWPGECLGSEKGTLGFRGGPPPPAGTAPTGGPLG